MWFQRRKTYDCSCGHHVYQHRPKKGPCYVCACDGYKGQNKYGNKRPEYGGRVYDSQAEAAYAGQLDFRLRAKDINGWKYHKVVSLDVNGAHVCNYELDFEVYRTDGITEWVEVKGFPTQEWLLKWKLINALYKNAKDVQLRLVMAR